MARTNIPNAILEGVDLIYLNFSGNPDKFHAQGGVRTFSVILSPKVAKAMEKDGWNVKWPKERPDADEGEEPRDPTLSVQARFDVMPPLVYMITSRNHSRLDEGMISILDSVDFKNVDLIINASSYKRNDGTTGIKAYLKSMYVTIEPDPLADKYADILDPVNKRGSVSQDDDD